MTIQAIFTGTNSLGYEKGKLYTLIIEYGSGISHYIKRIDGTGLCPYSSFVSFLENWNEIKVISK